MLFCMGRRRRISRDAKSTTISLTLTQQIAFQELQVKRLKMGKAKPTLTEVMLEGLEKVLRQEDWPGSELEKIFPKQEQPSATVRIMPKGRRAGK